MCVDKYMYHVFTQHAWLPLQQWQDVLVEEKSAEAEEAPEAQVGHGAPVPDPWLRLDHRGLCDGDLQQLFPRQAVAAGQHHALPLAAERRQEVPKRMPRVSPTAQHHICCLRAHRGPTGGW